MVFLLGASSCATLHDGDDCWTETCRAERDEAQWKRDEAARKHDWHRRQIAEEQRADECRRTLRGQPTEAERVSCTARLEDLARVQRQRRWTSSGVTCSDRRISERLWR